MGEEYQLIQLFFQAWDQPDAFQLWHDLSRILQHPFGVGGGGGEGVVHDGDCTGADAE